jgi:hypothetical protein
MKRQIAILLIVLMLPGLFFTGCGRIPNSSETAYANSDDEAPANAKSTDALIYVKPGDDINDAVSKVENGGVIVLEAGTYKIKDTVVISGKENITMKGEGEVWLDIEGIDHHVITVSNCRNIEFHNIKAQHVLNDGDEKRSPEDARNGSVIGVIDSTKVLFLNCELVGCGIYGLYARNTSEIDINGCYIHHNSLKALRFESFKGVVNVYIKGSRIINNMDYLEKEGNVNIIDGGNNTITDNNEKAYKEL